MIVNIVALVGSEAKASAIARSTSASTKATAKVKPIDCALIALEL